MAASVPADRHEHPRARHLPDGVVYWIGALSLAVAALVHASVRADAAVGRFLLLTAWPWLVRTVRGTGHQLSGAATKAARAAPAWAATRRTRLALWAAPAEETVRRVLRTTQAQSRRDVRAFVRSTRVQGWARRAAGAGAAAVLAVALLVVASGPVLSVVAHLAIGDQAREDLPDLAQTSQVVAREGTPLGVVERERRALVEVDSLPEHVPGLVLAAEDHRFADHEGYDLTGLVRAAFTNARAGEVEQGGSTITQQLAKLNFTGDAPSFARKAQELLYAVRLEDELSKSELLERYLNQVYFGNGAHGIGAAAEEYFGVAASDLTPSQAATLAGVIQRPSTLDPRENPEAVERRRDSVLGRAAAAGFLDRDDAAAAAAEPLQLADPAPRPRTDPILDAVRAEVRTLEALGSTPEERLERLESGGLRVETTLDPALQMTTAAAIAAAFGDEGPTAAVAAVDPRTGAVRALRSGRDGAGGFDLARQGRRQPGSTFKPLTAVAALEQGLSLRQPLVGDGPVELDHGGPEPWRVDNFDGQDLGSVDLREALRTSVNTAFAQLGVAVGVDAIADVAERVGIDPEAALGTPDQRGPSVALGGIAHGVSPLELAMAYTPFATDGSVAEPYLVERVLDRDGNVIHERDPEARRAIDPAIAGQVRSMLESAVHEGTGRAARIDGIPVFGKTGTSQDGADAWFVGSTTDLTTAVWIGHPDGRVSMPEATGGRLAAPIWREITASWASTHPIEVMPAAAPADDGPGLTLPRPRRTT
jgi:membrane peptidoglycan carboxypeptidase